MKKFLVTFIIGVVLMAIGTTALVFEFGEFERVDATSEILLDTSNFHSETLDLKDGKNIKFQSDYEHQLSYHFVYDENMKDRVKISFMEGIDYNIKDEIVTIIDVESMDVFHNGWDMFQFVLDGLKERKFYQIALCDIVITTSQKNRDRFEFEYMHEKD